MPARRQSLPEIAFHAYARACGTSGNWQDASPEWKAVFTAIASDLAREIGRRVGEDQMDRPTPALDALAEFVDANGPDWHAKLMELRRQKYGTT